jgi:hypothetical protein
MSSSTSSSFSSVQLSAPQAGVVTKKLGGDNFPLFKAQVMHGCPGCCPLFLRDGVIAVVVTGAVFKI